MDRSFKLILWLGILVVSMKASGYTAKIKNIAQIKGVRPNYLQGYGVVFGLQGTGDSAKNVTTLRTVSKMMNLIGQKNEAVELTPGTFAQVLVTATLPPFSKNGTTIDVRVVTSGDAQSLAGGTLFQTWLKAGDGNVYVIASGPVVVAQASGTGTSVLTSAVVPNGGMVEREFSPQIVSEGKITLTLKHGGFSDNNKLEKAVNNYFKGFYARSLDYSSLDIELPQNYQDRPVEFISKLENIEVEVAEVATVTINERTGTVVMGGEVKIAPLSIAHGALTITIGDKAEKDKKGGAIVPISGVSVGEVVSSLNQLGVSPQDLVSILQAINAAGALKGELIFI